jgi:hypothetical protein
MSCSENEKSDILASGQFNSVYYLRVSEDQPRQRAIEQDSKPVVELDYVYKFRKSFLEKVGESSVVLEELAEVLNG